MSRKLPRASNTLYHSDEQETRLTFQQAMELYNWMVTQEIDIQPTPTPLPSNPTEEDIEMCNTEVRNDAELREIGKQMHAACDTALAIYEKHESEEDAATEMQASEDEYVQAIGRSLENQYYGNLAM